MVRAQALGELWEIVSIPSAAPKVPPNCSSARATRMTLEFTPALPYPNDVLGEHNRFATAALPMPGLSLKQSMRRKRGRACNKRVAPQAYAALAGKECGRSELAIQPGPWQSKSTCAGKYKAP
jgi:hypothetical protein